MYKAGFVRTCERGEFLRVNLRVAGRAGSVRVCARARAKLDFSFGWAAGKRDRSC